ncbi:hypothetical protein QJS10_CPA03g00271 [Acorus calamus]|uniref:Uncharacterized protein n=1 Tax=Acorus calamus TaxID=4465 RepID=A0AAV9F875_ACOCL|nr:hypothetical protein QJS10_CPA03g00271 [Acorus calamus]
MLRCFYTFHAKSATCGRVRGPLRPVASCEDSTLPEEGSTCHVTWSGALDTTCMVRRGAACMVRRGG